jgi:nicotinamide mononucleotide transporter
MSWDTFVNGFLLGVHETSVASWVATVTAFIYIWLASKENAWCWPFGIVSSAASVIVYREYQLPFESILNILYCVLGVYGWISWRQNENEKKVVEQKQTIVGIKTKTGIILLLAGILSTIICGAISEHYKTSSFPWADAGIFSFSVIATWMTARKIIENWLVWIVADIASVCVYLLKGPEMYLFVVLFIVYTFMAITGYISWSKKRKKYTA